MPETANIMETSDIIQLISVLVAIGIGITSVVISVKALKQNNLLMRESSRAYLSVYGAIANFQELEYYLVLKNFGQGGATLTSLTANMDLSLLSDNPDHPPFIGIDNTFIAPGQSFVCPISSEKFNALKTQAIIFDLYYSSNGFNYHDAFSVNLHAFDGIKSLRASTKGQELRNISFTLQDIAEHQP